MPEESKIFNQCLVGDCRDSMRKMLSDGLTGKVQCCVTSPPYFGLRDYGHPGQLGLEETPEQYIRNMVDVFRIARDLLADDGTLWLNIGDSYARTGGSDRKPSPTATVGNTIRSMEAMPSRNQRAPDGLKEKDLIGIPWMLAFALRADGWYLRQDIIWAKPNPMPESVLDRCTKSHEYLFLLSKSGRYYFDQKAIKEPAAPSSLQRWSQNVEGQMGSARVPGKTNGTMKSVGGQRSRRDSFKREGSKRGQAIPGQYVGTHREEREESSWDLEVRNRRSVWNIATTPYEGAHFATFPEALVEPCILAGSRGGDIVLDMFLGSGTTAQVAQRLGRKWVGCELNPEYLDLQRQRTAQLGLELVA